MSLFSICGIHGGEQVERGKRDQMKKKKYYKMSVCLSTILSVSLVKLLLNAHIKLFCVSICLSHARSFSLHL